MMHRRPRPLAVMAASLATLVILSGCSLFGGTGPSATPTPTSTAFGPAKPSTHPADADSGFVLHHDNSGVLSVNAPEAWTEVSGAPISNTGGTLTVLNLKASPNIAAYQKGWDVPGVSVSATNDPALTMQTFVDNLDTSIGPQCDTSSTGVYDDTVYAGSYTEFTHCGGTSTDFLAIVAQDAAKKTIVITTIQMVSDADKTVNRDEILKTFFAIYQ